MFSDTVEGMQVPFTGDDLGPALDAFLATRPAPPRVLALGEPTHGIEAFGLLRNALLRHLVEHAGFRAVAVESDVIAGLVVDDFVCGGPGDLDAVMAGGFSHGFGASPANRALVTWLREHNRDRDPAGRVRFHGIDAPTEMMYAQSPRAALLALHAHLAGVLDRLPCDAAELERLVGDDARWTDTAAAMDPARSIGAAPEVAALRVVTDDLVALLYAERPRLAAATSRDAWWRARLHGRAAAGLLRYHAAMAVPGDGRMSRLSGLRDAMMAENLLAAAGRDAPLLVFAHNLHVQRDHGAWREGDQVWEWWCAGAIAAEELGDAYTVVAGAMGSARDRGLGPPAPDTAEGSLPAGRTLVDPAVLRGTVKRSDVTARMGYFPIDPARLDGTDAIAYLDTVDVSPVT